MSLLLGVHKSILVLLSVGEEMAAELVKNMNAREIRRVSAAISNMPKIEPEEVVGVMEEFLGMTGVTSTSVGNNKAWMRNVVEKALGTAKAQQLLQGLKMEQKTLELLWEIDPNSLANLIRKEHPQTQALILAYLDANKAAHVLPLLPIDEQTDIMLRIAKLESIHPDILQEVEEGLMEEVQMMGTLQSSEAGGVDMVVEMLNVMDKKTEKTILGEMEDEAPDLAEEIKSKMFVFENLTTLNDRTLQLIMREVDTNTLTMALKTAPEDLRDKLLGNVSSRAAQMIMEDLEALGPQRLADVETGQMEIVQVALRLEEEGRISISRGGEEEYV